jgi:hypothetical protein
VRRHDDSLGVVGRDEDRRAVGDRVQHDDPFGRDGETTGEEQQTREGDRRDRRAQHGSGILVAQRR